MAKAKSLRINYLLPYRWRLVDGGELSDCGNMQCAVLDAPKKESGGNHPRRIRASDQWPYAHFGSPSLLAGASAVDPTYTEHVLVVVVWVTLAVNPFAVTVIVGPTTPVVVAYAVPRLLVYFTESAKYASSAVIRLRRSDFIEARYAFSFVFANFGIAIAARIPIITTTISSSISVKPLRFIWTTSREWPWDAGVDRTIRSPPIILASHCGTNCALVEKRARKIRLQRQLRHTPTGIVPS